MSVPGLPKTRSVVTVRDPNMQRQDLNSNKENINIGASQLLKKKTSENHIKIPEKPCLQEKPIPNSSKIQNTGSIHTLEEIKQNNPQYVTAYSKEILTYLLKKEAAGDRGYYFDKQKDVNEKMREILIDWLVDVSVKFRLLSSTLFMSVNLIDRYMNTKNDVARDRLQLLGITALFIASKYEEIYPPHMKEYINVCDKATYSKQDMLDMEAKVIVALDFNLTDSTALKLLERFGRVAGLESKAFMFARYQIELAQVDSVFITYPNSLVAASAVYLTNKVFKREEWSLAIADDSQQSLYLVRPPAKELYMLLHKAETSNMTAVRRKFASKSYLEISKYKLEFKC